MKNRTVCRAVDSAVYGAVWGAVALATYGSTWWQRSPGFRAMPEAVSTVVYGSVYVAVDKVVNLNVRQALNWALERSASHRAIEPYLMEVAC
jgi:hypothetical protein